MKNKLYLYNVKQLNITVMKQSFYTGFMLVIFFIVLGIFGVYLNFINEEPDHKTFLFLVVLGILWFITRYLIKKEIKDRQKKVL